jgi:hypothetical protein
MQQGPETLLRFDHSTHHMRNAESQNGTK